MSCVVEYPQFLQIRVICMLEMSERIFFYALNQKYFLQEYL